MCELDNCQHGGEDTVGMTAISMEEIDQPTPIRNLFSKMFRSLVRIAPIIERQAEVSAACACSGVCPNCISAGVGSAILSGLSARSSREVPVAELDVDVVEDRQ